MTAITAITIPRACIRFLSLLLLSSLLTACMSTPSPVIEQRELTFDTRIHVGKVPVQVVVFDTPDRRALGLMHVEELAVGTGALFVFEQSGKVGFWMKNTLIPLDMLFFDEKGKALKFIRGVPPCKQQHCPTYGTDNVRYVLEVPAGFIEQQQLTLQDSLMLND